MHFGAAYCNGIACCANFCRGWDEASFAACTGLIGGLTESQGCMHVHEQVRLGEKEALESTLQFFESRAKRLGDLEYYQERRLKSLGLLDDQGQSTYDDFFKDSIA